MSEFHECVVGTFDEELQALIDYGHDCCARIDDRIHECCQRIRKAHEREIGAFELALRWKDVAPLPQYDALGNERHKVVCKLREMPDCYPSYSAFPFAKWYEDLSTALGIDKGEVSCAKVRDTLIHLLGGDAMEVEDGVDAGRCGDTSAGGDVLAAAGRVDNCAGDQLAEELAPITQELRDYMEAYKPVETETSIEVARIGTMGYQGIMERCDVIDAIHAQLEHDVEMWRDRAEDMRMERDDALKEHHADSWKRIIEDALTMPFHSKDDVAQFVARCKALAGDADE